MREKNRPGLAVRYDRYESLRMPVRRARVRRGMRGAAERLELAQDHSVVSTTERCPGMVFDFDTTGHEVREHSCFLCSSHTHSLDDEADEHMIRDLVAWEE